VLVVNSFQFSKWPSEAVASMIDRCRIDDENVGIRPGEIKNIRLRAAKGFWSAYRKVSRFLSLASESARRSVTRFKICCRSSQMMYLGSRFSKQV
jgi:hypothetical protein